MSETASAPIRIGVSACLLGEKVRFDGGHKRDPYLVETFGRYVEWVPVCPEVELGLGTPRETLRLVRISSDVRMIMPKTGADHTEAMRAYAARRVRELAKENLSGYILKKDSPSCGMERVRVFDAHGVPAKSGRGLFAEALLQHFPLLPVEEEGRLTDPRLRENFIERVFAYARLRSLFSGHWKVGDLVAFQTAHKLLLMAHSPQRLPEPRSSGGGSQVSAARGTSPPLRVGIHGRAAGNGHNQAAYQRASTYGWLFQQAARFGLAPGVAVTAPGLSCWSCSPGRSAHADPPLRPQIRCHVSARASVPGTPSQRTHAEEPRVAELCS